MASHGDDRALEASERMMGEDAVVAWWGGVPLLPPARWGWFGLGRRGDGARWCRGDFRGLVFDPVLLGGGDGGAGMWWGCPVADG